MMIRTVKKHFPLATTKEAKKIIQLSELETYEELDKWLNDYIYISVEECYERYDDLLSTTYTDMVDNFLPHQVIEELADEQKLPLYCLSENAFLLEIKGELENE